MMDNNTPTASARPLALLSNDDGYQAKGLRQLISVIAQMGLDVLVCAPDGPRSGYSRAFSADKPLRLTRRTSTEAHVEIWSCNGTPVDCVKLAYSELLHGRTPDIVIGGINHGDNSTVNMHYSGTMGVALEGCMKYLPSVAFSLCDPSPDADFAPMAPYIRQVVSKVLEKGLPRGICLNVNFPKAQEFKGVRVCRMTFARWTDEVVKCRHPFGYDYFWMAGYLHNDEPDAEDTDQWALNHGYVAVTPTNLDVTAYEFMDEVRSWVMGDR